ncbi:MAG: bestrophin family protein [Candidatus Cyclobacteriaceae bacterium M2_1C_046]
MVTYNPKNWFSLIFHSYSRYVIRLLLPALFVLGLYTLLLAYFVDYFELDFRSTTVVHSLLGIVLGLFLVFRWNSAYDRWWEGRKHWGSLVNNTRNLALKMDAFLGDDDIENRSYFAQMIPNFAVALKEHLRDNRALEKLDIVEKDFPNNIKSAEHIPNILTAHLYRRINSLYKGGKLTGDQFFVLDKELKQFSEICGACERIKNTPIPYSYSMYIKKFIFTYVITLPFGFLTSFYYWTIPIVIFVLFILLSIELIAEEIEDPFGNDINDLPTDELSDKIKKNVREILMTEHSIRRAEDQV